jgi:protoheme IX farnesyltransferase
MGRVLAMATMDTERGGGLGDWWQMAKPRLNLLVLMTALAGYALAPDQGPRAHLAPFALGVWLLAASAAMLNMWMEREGDAQMERTRQRPLAAGRLNPRAVLWTGLAISLAALLLLDESAGLLCAGLGLATWSSYLLLYTPLKRVTPLALLVGAVPGALPPVLGWVAGGGSLDGGALALFCFLFLWQIPHFLSIAALYGAEYRKAGIKVLGLEHGPAAAGRSMVLYAAALLPVAVWFRGLGIGGPWSLLLTLALTVGFVAAALWAAFRPSRGSARGLLLASVSYQPLFLLALIFGNRP